MSETSKNTDSATATYTACPVNGNGVPAPARPLTYEEFLEWADEDTLAEWVDGEIEMSSPASLKHQQINRFLTGVLDSFVRMNDLGEVVFAPFQMKLPKGGPGREPDIIYVNKANLGRLRKTYLDGPADLAVEITSPESLDRDRRVKFQQYAIGGVKEYWFIDPLRDEAAFYQLDNNGQYQKIPLEYGKYTSRELPGLWLQMDWLWQAKKPGVEDVLLQVSGQTYLDYLLKKARRAGFEPK